MASLGDLMVRMGVNLEALDAGLASASAKLDRFVGDAEQKFSGFEKFGQNMTALGVGLSAALTVPIVGTGVAALEAAGKMEQFKVAFTTLLHSGEAANKMLEDLRQFALKTPFNFPDLVTAAQRLLAMGTSAQDLIPRLRLIGDTVSALGGGPELFNRIALALSQMQNSAKLSAQDMKQLTEAGISGWKYLSDATGIAMKDIQEKAKQVLTGAQASQIIMQGLARDFAGGMEAQSKTLVGMWSNVQDAVKFALADIGNTLLPLGKQIVEKVIQPLLDGAVSLAHWFAKLPTPIQSGALALAGLAAIVGPLLAGLGALSLAIGAIGSALGPIAGILGITTSGFLAIGAAAAVVVSGLVALSTAFPEQLKFLGEMALAVGAVTIAMQALPAIIAVVSAAWAGFGFTSIISGFASIGTRVVELAGVLEAQLFTRLGSATTLLGTVTQATFLVAAAFAGWKLGEWLYNNIPLVQRFGDILSGWITSIPVLKQIAEHLTGISSATSKVNEAMHAQQAGIDQLKAKLAQHGVVIEQGSMSTNEYVKALLAAATKLGDLGNAANLAKKAVADHATAQKKANEELKLAQKVLSETRKLFKEGAASQEDVAIALKKVQEASAKAHPELHQTGEITKALAKETGDLSAVYDKSVFSAKKFNTTLLEQKVAIADGVKHYNQYIEAFQKGIDPLQTMTVTIENKVTPAVKKMHEEFLEAANKVTDSSGKVIRAADQLGNAFSTLGITSSNNLKITADRAKEAFETISNSGIATKGEIEQAWVAMTRAQIAYQQSLGNDTTVLEGHLKRMEDSHRAHVKNASILWADLGQQVSLAIQGWGRDLTSYFHSLLDGNFSLENLTNLFKSLGHAIADVFLRQAAQAITTFISDHLSELFNWLGKILERIPLIGDALGGVLQAAGGAQKTTTPSSPTSSTPDPTGGTGSAAGGITGLVGAIGSVVGAIGSIGGWITGIRQEGTLNAIESNTRKAELYLGDRADGGILGQMFVMNEHLGAGIFVKALESIRDFIGGNIGYIVGNLDRIKEYDYYALLKLDEIRDAVRSLASLSPSTASLTASFSPNVSLAPLVSGGSGTNVQVSFYDTTILDDRMIDQIGDRITDRIRTIVR